VTTETPYTGTQVAALFGVHVSTIVRWADDGRIPSFRTPGGQRRYPRQAIDALLVGAA
jgi:excisionase family DNA binding protein